MNMLLRTTKGPTENRQGEWAPWLNIIIIIIIIIIFQVLGDSLHGVKIPLVMHRTITSLYQVWPPLEIHSDILKCLLKARKIVTIM